VVRDEALGNGDVGSRESAAVLARVLKRERVRARGVVRKCLCAGESCGIGGRLGRAVSAVPGADVQDQGGHPEQDRQEDDRQDRGLAVVVAGSHSTRSVVVLERFPLLSGSPSNLLL